MDQSSETDTLLTQALAGDTASLNRLLSRDRERLTRAISLRLNSRLQGRVDASDIVQEACFEASKRLVEFARDRQTTFYVWLRFLAGQKLVDACRRHLGAQQRDAGREISLHSGPLPTVSSLSLAEQLMGRHSSPSQAAIRAELRLRVQEALNQMDPIDREVLALRHFEQLNNVETAQILGLSESGATARYLRALKRLGLLLGELGSPAAGAEG